MAKKKVARYDDGGDVGDPTTYDGGYGGDYGGDPGVSSPDTNASPSLDYITPSVTNYLSGDNSGAPTAAEIAANTGDINNPKIINTEIANDPASTSPLGMSTSGSGSSTAGNALNSILKALGLGGSGANSNKGLQTLAGLLAAAGTYKQNSAYAPKFNPPAMFGGSPGSGAPPAAGSSSGYGPPGGYAFGNYKGVTANTPGLGFAPRQATNPGIPNYYTYGQQAEQPFFSSGTPPVGTPSTAQIGAVSQGPPAMKRGGHVKKFMLGGLNTGITPSGVSGGLNPAPSSGSGTLASALTGLASAGNGAMGMGATPAPVPPMQHIPSGNDGMAPMTGMPPPMTPQFGAQAGLPPPPANPAGGQLAGGPPPPGSPGAATAAMDAASMFPGVPQASTGVASGFGPTPPPTASAGQAPPRAQSMGLPTQSPVMRPAPMPNPVARPPAPRPQIGLPPQPVRPGLPPMRRGFGPVMPGNRMAEGGQPTGMPPQESTVSRHVKGPGDGTSDSIPARLANGEYVMDAQTVSMAGNGDNGAGAKNLDAFRENIRKHKGAALAKGKMAPDAHKDLMKYLPAGKQ